MNFGLGCKYAIFRVILSTNPHFILSSYVPRFFLLSFLFTSFFLFYYLIHYFQVSSYYLVFVYPSFHSFFLRSYLLSLTLFFILFFSNFFRFLSLSLSFCPMLKQNASKKLQKSPREIRTWSKKPYNEFRSARGVY